MTFTHSERLPRSALGLEAGGAATESAGGVGVVVLSILALVGLASPLLTQIAGIVFGAAFIVEGAAMAARRQTLLAATQATGVKRAELTGGITVEMVVGAAAIVLGILAIAGIASDVLMACLAIAGGVGLIFSTAALEEMNEIGAASIESGAQPVARASVFGAAGVQVLAGLASGTLGVLALIPAIGAHAVLIEVALLVLGASLTISGSALSGRMLGLMHKA